MNHLSKIIAGICLASANASYGVAAQNYDAMHKQLNIMNNIFKSAIGSEQSRSGISSINSTYLKGQGVVFTVSSRVGNQHFGSYDFNFVMPELPKLPAVPAAPQVPDVNNGHYERNIQETINREMEKANQIIEVVYDSMNESREMRQEFREAQRDLEHDMRDLEREKRDLEFQKRHANKEQLKEIESSIKSIASQKSRLQAERRQFEQKMTAYAKEQKANKEQQQKDRQKHYSQLSQGFAETLCMYGNGLKALPKNESVSVIMKSGGTKVKGHYKDKIYVFSKSDINACSNDKISAAKLVEKGNGYEF